MPYNNQNAPQNWQSIGASGYYGNNHVISGGGGQPVSHGELDRLRIGQGRTPEAEYPDGFLGTIPTRRGDRLLSSLKSRVNQRSYQRGVHKGERIDPSDYCYPLELQPDRGLRRQMRGRATSNGMVVPRASLNTEFDPAPHLVNDGKADTVAEQPLEVNLRRREQLARLMPSWTI